MTQPRGSGPLLGEFFSRVSGLLSVADFEGHFIELNPAWEDVLGWTVEEIKATQFMEFLHPEDVERTAAAFAGVLEGERVAEFENRYRRKDGQYVWLSWHSVPDLDARIIYSTTRDITAEKQDRLRLEAAEARARSAETRSRSVLETAVDGIIVIDAHGIIQSFNPAAGRIFGYASHEVVGQNVSLLTPQPHRARHDGYVQRYLDSGEAKIIGIGRTVEGVRKDGSRFPLELAISEMRIDGQVFFTGLTRDISKRRAAELALAEKTAELELSATFDAASATILRCFNRAQDPTAAVGEMLSVLAQQQGYRPSAFYQTDDWRGRLDLLSARGMPEGFARSYGMDEGLIGSAVESREAVYLGASDDMPVRLDTGLGMLELASLAVVPVAHQERVLGVLVLGSLEPLTARRRAFVERIASEVGAALHSLSQFRELVQLSEQLNERGREIERANQDLRRANKAKSEFLANMSHELRTPLNAVIGFSEVLRDGRMGPLAEQQAEYVGEIFDAGQHLLSLINDILDLSKIEAGKMDLELESVAADELLKNSLSIVKERAYGAGVELEASIDESVGTIRADGRKLRQVVYNLLANAVKFTGKGGKVRIEARREHRGDAAMLQIAVIDTGIGISEADQARVFLPFQQADGSTSRRYEGTGLGLTLVHKIVELHGGEIELESALGVGSTFTVRIPIGSSVAEGAQRLESVAEPIHDPAAPLVLVIEDDDAAARLLEAQLTGAGYRVVHGTDAETGLALLGREGPDLVVLDILLPGVDGWEILDRLKSHPKTAQVPVVVVSIVADQQRGAALGASAVFQKPVDPDQLISAIESAGVHSGEGGTARILVVDDDTRAVAHVARQLESRGYRVTRAFGGAEAIRFARAERPDAIVLDLMMPDVTGFDVVAELNGGAESPIPIVVLTAKELTASDRERLAGGVKALLGKRSSDMGELLREVRRATRTRSAKTSGSPPEPAPLADRSGARAVLDLPPQSRPLILIVDDEARDRELLRLYLEDAGYVIIEAADGEEGRRLVSDRKPDLVLLDLQLPKLDGLALLQHFSEESVQTPVVVVSGAADLGGARTLGADVCLSKPVPRHTLLEAVRGLVPGPGEDARGRVLVIDDDPRSLSVVSGFLAGTGLVVETAIAGAEGLARIVADPPDVVILDLMMPEMSGFEVLAQLRDDPNTRGIPVVVLTSLTPTASQMRQLQAGAAEVFRKADTRGPDLLGQIRLLLARGRGSQ